jgi:hypothetical protein
VLDVAKAGGIAQMPGLPVPPGDPAVRSLEAHASLSRMSQDLQFNAALIEQGFTSPLAIARGARTAFVGAAQGPIGDVKSAAMHVAAHGQTMMLHNATVEVLSNKANGFDHPAPSGMPDFTAMLPAKCGCDDCQPSGSPTRVTRRARQCRPR